MTAQYGRATVLSILSIVLAACAEAPPDPLTGAPQFSHAATGPDFGAKASGSELLTPGIVTDGGPGSTAASVAETDFTADAQLAPGATYLPELKAFARNTTALNDDDFTQATAEAYQAFTSSTAQTIQLDVRLSGSVVDGTTDVSYALADVFVYGGPAFEIIESPICEDGSLGQFLFDGTYFCGTRLERANLYIPVGDLTVPDVLTFDVAAGATFGVYAVLRAAASGGTADASQTLVLEFDDDQYIAAVGRTTNPPGVTVQIAVKPGSDPNCLNPASRGVIPVAIFGSDAFDVVQVDRSSLTLNGLPVRLRPGNAAPQCAVEDVNGDGHPDLTCHFANDEAAWSGAGGEAELLGVLLDGTRFSGTDAVCVVPRTR